jgi:type 1 glutamine amidotransferase
MPLQRCHVPIAATIILATFLCAVPSVSSLRAEGKPPHVVFLISEPEYRTDETLPVFAKRHLEPRGVRTTVVLGDANDGNRFPGLEDLQAADLILLSVRRRALPVEQLQWVRDHLEAGKPLVGIRTANHAFHTRGKRPPGHAEWQEFDAEVLGGNYHGHHGSGPLVRITAPEGALDHPVLRRVSLEDFVSHGSLYEVSPLAERTTTLLMGTIPDQAPEPVAWTSRYRGGRIFYTSLGHVEDFGSASFNRLLVNAVFWALDRPVAPPRDGPAP